MRFALLSVRLAPLAAKFAVTNCCRGYLLLLPLCLPRGLRLAGWLLALVSDARGIIMRGHFARRFIARGRTCRCS
eukprot:5849863-Pleurochrysis_carterae.AAC.1